MRNAQFATLFSLALAGALALPLVGCGAAPSQGDGATTTQEQSAEGASEQSTGQSADSKDQASEQKQEPAQEQTPAQDESAKSAATLADGTYEIEAETDSSMFRSEKCLLTVKDGQYTAELTLPGEGFSRLFYGTAEEAAEARDAAIHDYYLNDDGKYTFSIPVSELDKELKIAAYGQRRDTWYDHTIVFHAPASE